ncbi:DUF1517 domain-containing protein [Spirulina sp. 06S082]|uniref:DUF1517 domain-containing protein n=1 Tax=Spirulina sp. 06S082 TaxID=3110248 RepID=UPI002B201A03|nr:DUF1517 domain-containing protein [Spirulina sp. 06S082]MEA5469939.1 DUF1517 domain-containing protein [Spirulina sp. 06S082]
MLQRILTNLKPFLKTLFVGVLILILTFAHSDEALARRSGGRIGGGSFRAPSRSYSAPSRSYAPRGGGYRSPGWGFGFPFLIPFFGFGGGGSLFTLLIFIAIGSFLVNTLRNSGMSLAGNNEGISSNTKISVGKVQVGLLAEARSLKADLDRLGRSADTGTSAGRAKVLQEVSLALLRHPEYWVYGSTLSQTAARETAEAKFSQLALSERSKFTAETLSNVDRQVQNNDIALPSVAENLAQQIRAETGEYIIVTLLVGVEGKLELAKINNTEDLTQSLRAIGGIGSDRLLALEILWTPQAEGDTLSTDDILAEYPDLKLV